MKILLFGKNGQVGWELQRSLAPLGEVVALASDSQDLCGNFTNLSGLTDTVRHVAPDIIVNAAAYTAVDKAEGESDIAALVNTEAVAVLAKEALRLNAWLVHYSTDYVFDGSGDRQWMENDPTNPLNVYGATKLAGEQHILQSGCKYLIFRTSWVYGARGGNFAKTMLRLAEVREQLKVIDDQTGAPTGAELLADVTAHAIRTARHNNDISGIYHLTASGETSWHGYASFVIDYARRAGVPLKVASIEPVTSAAFPTPARRPHNSRLNTKKLRQTFDLYLPNWQAGVERMLSEVLGNGEVRNG